MRLGHLFTYARSKHQSSFPFAFGDEVERMPVSGECHSWCAGFKMEGGIGELSPGPMSSHSDSSRSRTPDSSLVGVLFDHFC